MINILWENFFRRDRGERTISSLLKENYLFQDLSPKDIKFVTEIIHLRTYRPGEKIFSQGEVGVGMYIIVKGLVEITVHETSRPGAKAEEITITKLEPGDFFGEIALVEENSRRSASAVSSTEVRVIGFYKSDLVEILQRNPAAGFQVVSRLAEVLGRRLRETTEKVSELKKHINELKSYKKSTES